MAKPLTTVQIDQGQKKRFMEKAKELEIKLSQLLRDGAERPLPEALCISGPPARACRSTCETFRTSLETGVTRPGTPPTRGTSCDRRGAAFRSRAYTPGSTDRHRAEASVTRASEERCEGRV